MFICIKKAEDCRQTGSKERLKDSGIATSNRSQTRFLNRTADQMSVTECRGTPPTMTPEVALAFPYVNDAHLESGDLLKGLQFQPSLPAISFKNQNAK